MAQVELKGACKSFGKIDVLKNIDLAIDDGEFIVFVGPSGCGKSTLLRAIAGLEGLSSGEVRIGDRVVNDVAPADRGIAMVFQSYALYPHMNLFDNLAFGLKLQGMPRAEIHSAVMAAAEMLDIAHLLDRKPRALSGGQRQRVAIGRAIVRQPKVFLFDEPLSNLDAALRVRMRYEFAALHKSLGTTMIYVTHDQVEAMTLADRIVVLSGGQIEQVGTPMELYEHPDTLFVAGFIGSPRMNLLPATILSCGSRTRVRLAEGIDVDVAIDSTRAAIGDAVTLGVRPEHILIGGTTNRIDASARFVEALGSTNFAYLDVPGLAEPLTCQTARRVETGAALTVSLPAEHLYLFDADARAFARPRLDAARNAA